MTRTETTTLAAAILALNVVAWQYMLDDLRRTPRTLRCVLVEVDPFGGRRYHTITTITPGQLDQSTGAIVCNFR